jgi:hypothetical protein
MDVLHKEVEKYQILDLRLGNPTRRRKKDGAQVILPASGEEGDGAGSLRLEGGGERNGGGQQELQPNGSGCAPFAAFFLDPFAALHLHPHAGAGLICTYSLGIPYTAEKGHGEKMLTS